VPSLSVKRSSPIVSDARVKQLEGIFDIPPSRTSKVEWKVDLPVESKPWNIGLIVGPSGCGKSTLAAELFPGKMVTGFEWAKDKAIVSGFADGMPVREITDCLSAVGFNSPPNWLRPFHVLSNGEQFRVTMARAISECKDLFVIDEFTSVVDRKVAQIGSHAVAKSVRKAEKQMVAVACHYDIIEWLQPDWIYEPATNAFQWRSLRRRPSLDITIQRVDRAAWDLFKKHHYLSADLGSAAQCWVAMQDGCAIAFVAMMHMPHPSRSSWRVSRIVCMPDFQGIGVAGVLLDYVASIYRCTRKPVNIRTGHYGLINSLARSKSWKMKKKPSLGRANTGKVVWDTSTDQRKTAAFEFTGAANFADAKAFSVV